MKIDKKKIIIVGVSTLIVGVITYFYFRRRKQETSKNIKDSKQTDKTENKDKSIIDRAREVLSLEPNKIDKIDRVENIQKDSKGYKFVNQKIDDFKVFFSNYKCVNNKVVDVKLGEISNEAQRTLYIYVTRVYDGLKSGVSNDSTLNSETKNLLISLLDNYFSKEALSCFPTSTYSRDKDWYKTALSKMSKTNFYI
jgi:hypothetical protein